MEGIFLVIVIAMIWHFIGYVGVKVQNIKVDHKKSKKAKEDIVFTKKRDSLNIFIPQTIDSYYPILLLPMNREIYRFGEGYYWIKSGFTSFENDKDDIYGASEKYFFKTLLKYFSSDKIKHNQLSVRINKDLYIPDFTYIDDINEVYIDIEIDEPYSFKTKEPIHYSSSDHRRNIFMQRGGWAVIRFSEKQIIQQADECCKFIASYLTYAYLDKSFMDKFVLINNLSIDKTWTKNEAEEFVSKNYRNSYLSLKYESDKVLDNINSNGFFLLRLISVHHAFTIQQIRKYSTKLKWGSGVQTFIDINDEYHPISMSKYGLCFNSNIIWTQEVIGIAKFEMDYYQGVMYNENAFPLLVEDEISANKEVILSWRAPDHYSKEMADEYYDEIMNTVNEISQAAIKVFYFSTLEDFIRFTNTCLPIYSLNNQLYRKFIELLNSNGIDIQTDILDRLKTENNN